MSRRKKNRSKKRKQRAGQKRHAKQQRRSKRKTNRSRQHVGPAQAACDCHSHPPRLPESIPLEPDPVQAEPGVATWAPPGGRIVVQGRSIEGGMVYIGSEVLSVSGYWTEPSVIDPDLPVDWSRADRYGETLDEWPSYPQMGPRARAGYLEWLAGGRTDEHAHIGYVLLFFYGLERRLLLDIGSDLDHPDVPAIVAEILRLFIIYGDQPALSTHAANLLGLLEGLACLHTDLESVPWDSDSQGWQSPFAVLVGVGKFVADGSRIPAEWALAYLLHHPETRLRTAARRCPSEFDELFKVRYRTRFRGGVKVRRPADHLHLSYEAASHGFRGLIVPYVAEGLGAPSLAGDFEMGYGGEVTICLDAIPDVTSLPTLSEKLWSLAEECTDELDTYSRFIGRNPDAAQTAAAISLLPDALIASHGGPILDGLRDWTSEMLDGGPVAVVPLDDLVQRWSPGRTDKLTKRDAKFLASLLGKIGIGVEPDVRFGAPTPRPGTSAVLFELPEGAADAPSATYTEAKPLVHLAAVVAGAGGSINPDQRRFVADHFERVPGLDAAERRRLVAHLEFLATGRRGMYGVKRTVEALPAGHRARIGSFLTRVATADGAVSQAEVTALEKVFGYLGLDETDVYRRLHGLDIDDSGPVTVRDAEPATRWAVPEAAAVTAPGPSVVLDRAKVQARLAETARVSALLDDIFVEETTSPETAPAPPRPEPGYRIDGLDTRHSQLLARLVSRPEWERNSVEELAGSLGLPFLDGALDVINEAAMDACGEPVVEGDDRVVLNLYAVKELI